MNLSELLSIYISNFIYDFVFISHLKMSHYFDLDRWFYHTRSSFGKTFRANRYSGLRFIEAELIELKERKKKN